MSACTQSRGWMHPRPRVLLSAYQCAPGQGSVSQIGWEWYTRLARLTPVTLVTHARNREFLQAQGAPALDSKVIYIDTEWFAGPLYRCSRRLFRRSEHSVFLVSSLDFYVYDRVATSLLQREQSSGVRWDVIHAVTPVSPLASTSLYKLGAPLVLGPWNGGLASPKMFPELMKQDSAWLYPVRRVGRLFEAMIGGTSRASTILTATSATLQAIPANCRTRCRPMLENGVDIERFQASAWPEPPGCEHPLRILFTGRLVPFKGLPMLLKAVASLKQASRAIHLRVLGDGPMAAEWKAQSRALGLTDCVEFLGGGSLEAVAEQMRWCHVFCLPSVRESGGAVLLEAMASARPVIAVQYGGPAELVDEQIGEPIPPSGTDATTRGVVSALQDVFDHPERWRQRGLAGRRKAERLYSWDAKVNQALELYAELMRPDAG